MGGFKGRALKKYDVIATQVNHNYKTNLGKQLISHLYLIIITYVIEGPQINEFDEETIAEFVNSDFKISDQSDRMGYRLKGNTVAPKIVLISFLNLSLWAVFKYLATVIPLFF